MAKKGKKAPDWAEIEREYRCGAFSTREVSRRHGIAESTIRHRAKRGKWEQDLKVRYQKELRIQRIAQDGRAKASRAKFGKKPADPVLDDATIKRAIETTRGIDNKHRKVASEQLKASQKVADWLNKFLDDNKKTITGDQLRFVTQAIKQNSHAIVNMINCERRSYGMDESSDENAPDAVKITFHRDKPPIEAK